LALQQGVVLALWFLQRALVRLVLVRLVQRALVFVTELLCLLVLRPY
jgi:hypothetical protein